ncbi:MAG: hypothetical protein ACI4FZ_09285 [Lachnospiraceae bacterium]
MGKFLNKMERKYGRYAIRNLSLVLIICYGIGYLLQILAPEFARYLVLNPYLILHGQVWRLVTWILIPPESLDFFTIIMLYFYFSIGTTLERTWGTFRYNVYLFSGMLFTVIGSFVLYGIAWMEFGDVIQNGALTAYDVFTKYAAIYVEGESVLLPAVWFAQISTYYINMSIFLGFAATFPDAQVMLMFLIPVKMKVLGIVYAVMLLYSFLMGGMVTKIVILASLLNFIVFFFTSRDFNRVSPAELKRRAEFQKKMRQAKQNGQTSQHHGRNVITIHKCAVCGKTELDDPNMEFRFCSKCDGNYEYCMDHLYTHEHVKRIVPNFKERE